MITLLLNGLNSKEIREVVNHSRKWFADSKNTEDQETGSPLLGEALKQRWLDSFTEPKIKNKLKKLAQSASWFDLITQFIMYDNLTPAQIASTIENTEDFKKLDGIFRSYDWSKFNLGEKAHLAKFIAESGVSKEEIEFGKALVDKMPEFLMRKYKSKEIVDGLLNINSVKSNIIQSINSSDTASGFCTGDVVVKFNRKNSISDLALGFLQPSLDDIDALQILPNKGVSYSEGAVVISKNGSEVTETSDNLDDVIKAINQLVGDQDGDLDEEETIQQESVIEYAIPTFKTSSNERVSEFPITHFVNTQEPYKWIYVRLSKLFEGDFSNLADAILPLNLSKEQMVERLQAIGRLISKGNVVEKIYDAIVTKRILKGRTQYNTRSIIYVSEVISELNQTLSKVSNTRRFYINLVLLALTLAELKNTGLLAVDFDFTFVVPRPIEFSAHDLVIKTIIRGEADKAFKSYALTVNKLRFGDSVVSAYDISQEILSFRHSLAEDLATFDIMLGMYQVLKNICLQVCLALPTKLLLKNPSLKTNSTINQLIKVSDYVDELLKPTNIHSIILEEVTSSEAEEVLRWFEYRLNYVLEKCVPLNMIKDTINIQFKKARNGNFSQVLVYDNNNCEHELMLAKFSQYDRKSSYSIYRNRRESLESRLNNLIDSATKPLKLNEFNKRMESEIQLGHLPSNILICSCSERDKRILARWLNKGKVQFSHENVISSLGKVSEDGKTSDTSELLFDLPLNPVEVFSVATSEIKLKNPYFYNQRLNLLEVNDAIWTLAQLQEINNIAKGFNKTSIGVVGLKDGVRAIFPGNIQLQKLDVVIKIPIQVGSVSFEYVTSFKQLYFNELVAGTSIMLNYGGNNHYTRNLVMLRSLVETSVSNVARKQPDMSVLQDKKESNFNLLSSMITGNFELSTLAQRVTLGIENKLAVELEMPSTELDTYTSINVHNQVISYLLSAILHHTGALNMHILHDVIKEAKGSKRWFTTKM